MLALGALNVIVAIRRTRVPTSYHAALFASLRDTLLVAWEQEVTRDVFLAPRTHPVAVETRLAPVMQAFHRLSMIVLRT